MPTRRYITLHLSHGDSGSFSTSALCLSIIRRQLNPGSDDTFPRALGFNCRKVYRIAIGLLRKLLSMPICSMPRRCLPFPSSAVVSLDAVYLMPATTEPTTALEPVNRCKRVAIQDTRSTAIAAPARRRDWLQSRSRKRFSSARSRYFFRRDRSPNARALAELRCFLQQLRSLHARSWQMAE